MVHVFLHLVPSNKLSAKAIPSEIDQPRITQRHPIIPCTGNSSSNWQDLLLHPTYVSSLKIKGPTSYKHKANINTSSEAHCLCNGQPSAQATADTIIIAFFFLLCPNKYTNSSLDEAMFFTLDNIQLFIHHCWLKFTNASDAEVVHACTAPLTFT